MTIPYNQNIPAAPDNPSVDQPNMETNTNSIFTYVAVDHVGFNVSGSGQHNQVTFNSNHVPSTPTSPPVLFTNTVGSNPQLFFYSNNTFSQYVNNTNGSTYLLGGMILKWGIVNLPGTGFNQPVSFPLAFPNNCFSVVAIANAASNAVTVAAVTSITASGFTAIKTSSSSSLNINYIAVGF